MIVMPIHRGLVLTFLGMGGVYRLDWTDLGASVVRPPADRPFLLALPGPDLALVAMGEG